MTKAEIQLIRSLGDKQARLEAGLFVAEGAKLVGELLVSGLRVRKIFSRGGELAGEQATAKEMERASHLKTPTDCLALVEIPRHEFDPTALRGRLVLALDGVQNPGNMGTIIRLADWFGIGDVVCSDDSADCFNPKVVQATMGALVRVRVHYGDLTTLIPQIGTPVFGTFLEGENLYGAKLSNEGIIVLGSEGRGISDGVAEQVTRRLFIPPYPTESAGAESLNVAVAAAIVCSEFRRAGTPAADLVT
ncbi:MAG: RNA methyltransferase [Alistipes sp.]|jgi:TrmH family RNA methyltransferase|nr:RNA methyltransferase [Alistipes sp.]